jgi:hypothetical protein
MRLAKLSPRVCVHRQEVCDAPRKHDTNKQVSQLRQHRCSSTSDVARRRRRDGPQGVCVCERDQAMTMMGDCVE